MISLKIIKKWQKEQDYLDRIIMENCIRKGYFSREDFILIIPRFKKTALLTEIGEFSNSTNEFKYWKTNKKFNANDAKEELIDCLHFYLSISNFLKINFDNYSQIKEGNKQDLNELILSFFETTTKLIVKNKLSEQEIIKNEKFFYDWLNIFENICMKLGMNEEETDRIYNLKNQKNQERQKNNY